MVVACDCRRERRMRRLLVLSTMILLVTALSATPAFAGKGGQNRSGTNGGGGKASGTLSLVLLDSVDGQAYQYDRVTFDVSTSATDRPFVGVRCWQGANWVYDGYVGFFPTYMFEPWLEMDSPYWSAGESADCTARLFYYDKRGREKLLATLDYPVAP